MSKIRKGDKVVVTAGRDKGKQGTVVRVVDDQHLVVENVNVVKRHTKPNPQRNIPGGIVDKEGTIHVSNVMLLNPATGKGERVGYKTLEDGRKVRVFRKSGEVADVK
jgi:large subunit ribosomal protein L24